jgi:hypothetical protein
MAGIGAHRILAIGEKPVEVKHHLFSPRGDQGKDRA